MDTGFEISMTGEMWEEDGFMVGGSKEGRNRQEISSFHST